MLDNDVSTSPPTRGQPLVRVWGMREQRKQEQLSLRRAARLANISRHTAAKMERGEPVTMPRAESYALALGCLLDEFEWSAGRRDV